MGHLLTLVCNVLFSKKYTILVEAILKSTKGGSSGGGYLKEYWVICLLWSVMCCLVRSIRFWWRLS